MNIVKIVALGAFVVLIGTQCFGAAVNQSQAELNKGLIDAVVWSRDEKIDDYLNRGAEINCVDVSGRTPLMIATLFNYANVIQKLLDRRVNVNVQNWRGDTPLVYAAQKGNLELVRVLLDRGALVDVQDILGETALMTVAAFDDEDQKAKDEHFNTMRVLVEVGRADLSLVNNRGETALDIARKNHNSDERILALLNYDAHIRCLTIPESTTVGGDLVSDEVAKRIIDEEMERSREKGAKPDRQKIEKILAIGGVTVDDVEAALFIKMRMEPLPPYTPLGQAVPAYSARESGLREMEVWPADAFLSSRSF